jgi:hypothetical protein
MLNSRPLNFPRVEIQVAYMGYEISAITPGGYVSRFEASADVARVRVEEYLAFRYEKVLVRRKGAFISRSELNYFVAWEASKLSRRRCQRHPRLCIEATGLRHERRPKRLERLSKKMDP